MNARNRFLRAVVFAAAAFAADRIYWGPLTARVQAAELKLDQAHEKHRKSVAAARRLEKLKEEVDLLLKVEAVAERRLPKTRTTIQDFGRLKDLAGKNGVTISEMAFEKHAVKNYFLEISCDVTALADARAIERFLKDLTLEEGPVQVGRLVLGPPRSDGRRQASFKILFYQYRA